LPFGESEATALDDRLVAGLREDQTWARAALVDRFGPHVRRVLVRVLGAEDPDHEDLVQEVLIRALQGVGALHSARALKSWLTSVAVFTAREHIRRRRRRRWLTFLAEPPDVAQPAAPGSVKEAARCVYRILDAMPVDERMPFALRRLGGLELAEVAEACGLSFSTARRRLAAAERRFEKLSRRYEALAPWREPDGEVQR
jgi:RNA polymerase sigma-70 factor (ECF subfamily)